MCCFRTICTVHHLEVLARLSAPLVARLQIALAGEHSLTLVDSWGALLLAIRESSVDLVILDPRTSSGLELGQARELLARHPTLPVVIYTTLAADSIQATVLLAQLGAQHVVLSDFDDEPRRFRHMIDQLPATRLSNSILGYVLPHIQDAPVPFVRAITRLFEAPQEFVDVDELARMSGMTRRSLDRWFHRSGLTSARTMILIARLTRAKHYMGDPGFLLEDIAKKLGYSSIRRFARQVRAATGMTPSIMRYAFTTEEFTSRMAALVCRPEDGSSEWETALDD
jgi:AraC-like DNA-binding protein